MPAPDPRTWLGRASALSATPVAAVAFVLAVAGGSVAATAAFAPHPTVAAVTPPPVARVQPPFASVGDVVALGPGGGAMSATAGRRMPIGAVTVLVVLDDCRPPG